MQAKHVLIAALFGVLATACGASPQEVCEHMGKLATEGSKDAPTPDTAECVKSVESKKEMQGLMKYREWANCVVDAKSLEAAEKC